MTLSLLLHANVGTQTQSRSAAPAAFRGHGFAHAPENDTALDSATPPQLTHTLWGAGCT
ncbi:MAG: hypothetical protein RML14_03255 [Meiothermus sp.]|uniref:hypothetical protein n=1 Tax=Meiothermus sp. TaxID=1955249 RepID=UPI00298ED41E|nr:hypothetical protein [Meiothermus sp.]MCX7739750.1 hypothetical protein [Meiothermus sp.]MDW8480906.1 hypothetical protein [Meiothermus sp.]